MMSMSVMVSPADVLTTIARSLVAMQRYTTVEDALNGMAITEVRRKITVYQRRIRTFERKYKTDFEAFGVRLQGRATPEEEDDWLAWRSALRMKADWERVYEGLRNGRAGN
jgi:hypothetical protein